MYGHLIRRGMHAAAQQLSRMDILEYEANEFDRQYPHYRMPLWGVAMIAVTTIAFILLAMSLEYTVRLVMVNLAIIESPSATVVKVYEPLKSEEKENDVLYVEIEETHVVPEKPITSSIRRTMGHLTSIGGFTARWRGVGIFIVYIMILGIFHLVLSRFMGRSFLANLVVDMASALIASGIHCAWTHATISTSTKRFRDRTITRSQGKQVLLPTALKVLAQEASVATIVLSAQSSFKLKHFFTSTLAHTLLTLIPFLVALISWLFVIIPAHVVLIRKEASLLAVDDETIVPFDRTFGNRVIPGVTVLSLRDAWKSFGGDAWRRVVMLQLKFFAIVLGLAVVYFHVLLVEAWAAMGDALPVLLASAWAKLQTIAF